MHELEPHYGARSGGVSSKGSSVGSSRGSSGNTTPTSGQLLAMSFPRPYIWHFSFHATIIHQFPHESPLCNSFTSRYCFISRLNFTLRSHRRPTWEINLSIQTVPYTSREYYRFLISQRSQPVHVPSLKDSPKMEVNQTEAITYEWYLCSRWTEHHTRRGRKASKGINCGSDCSDVDDSFL